MKEDTVISFSLLVVVSHRLYSRHWIHDDDDDGVVMTSRKGYNNQCCCHSEPSVVDDE